MLLPRASHIAGIIVVHQHTQLIGWDGGPANYLPGLDLYSILLSSWDYLWKPPYPTIFCFLDNSYSDWNEIESQDRFDLHSLMAKDVKHFSCIYWLFVLIHLKSVQFICPYFWWDCFLFWYLTFLSSLHILDINLWQINTWQRFSPFL
jgi:hypothetical protein